MYVLYAGLVFYIVIGLVVWLLLRGPLARQREVGPLGAIGMCIFWPLTLNDFRAWIKHGERPSWYTGAQWDPAATAAAAHSPPKHIPEADYNRLVFGADEDGNVEEEIDDGDVEAFIHAQFGHQSAPLGAVTTIIYKRTGVSKTYAAGTIFPDEFLADWKDGVFARPR